MPKASSEITSRQKSVKAHRSYAEKLRDPRWQKMRLNVMQRDGFTCSDCLSKSDELHVHHCFYERGNPWDTHPDLLMTLCTRCHEERQELEDDIRRRLGALFACNCTADLMSFLDSLVNAEEIDSPIVCDKAVADKYIDIMQAVDGLQAKWKEGT